LNFLSPSFFYAHIYIEIPAKVYLMSKKLIDLTQPFFNGMPYNWYIPGVPRPELKTIVVADETKARLGFMSIVSATHIGTHVDAQNHVLKDGMSIDQYPLERFFGPAVCWDVSNTGKLGLITSEILKQCEPKMKLGESVLLYTGYGKNFESNYHQYYEQPYLTIDGARWLVKSKANAVGIDGHTVDRPYALRSTAFVPNDPQGPGALSPAGAGQPTIHYLLLSKNILIIEHMMNLDQVAGKRFTLSASPQKLRGADGAPARCIAIL
jgi:kynurenine formamidase